MNTPELGLAIGFAGPLPWSLVLDAAGGGTSGIGWALAFSSLAAARGLGILAFVLFGRHTFSGTTNGLR